MSKPFLILSSRADAGPAASEAEAVPRIAGLGAGEYRWVRMEQVGLPAIDLDEWSGIIMCGSPFDVGRAEEDKPEIQKRIEARLHADLYPRILEASFPFLGICYGLGTLTVHLGGAMDSAHGEEISAPLLHLSDKGAADPLSAGLPRAFHSYVGHHEGVARLGEGATVLVTGQACPIHMVRYGDAAWCTQFHPELDLAGIENRIDNYAGRYYEAARAKEIRAMVRSVNVSPCHSVLSTFVRLHRR
ncbi:gamma-glutamyl-gamma-aminobutyrate hydrolase family protein [Schaalia sp. 19OD2882]|uniref:glutamine amidotransferase-related protein n=1 Tax=Schaalia sp. 19OD2882 TaxID=2794089 RepID=UPI001C1F167E|nr:gamma-glutamyl-gamma-aminobutyrate hydrolase family protein [Schaalia sp. 19OD2882]QWW20320.1 gamma-glutamyl-gamma-aminobutyrate hydrolase family protein [Schaalia sp. 19OD2882]